MSLNLDESIEHVRQCKFLEERQLKQLCELIKDLLLEESNVQPVASPITLCGDIHGQFYDLLELFRTGGEVEETNYVFMGDFVDRGYYSLETFTLLLLFKARYPHKVTLLRGNHETRQITQVYGFYDECLQKYGSANAWKYCTHVFDLLGIAALVDGRVFCVHGGLSPLATSLDLIRTLVRDMEVPHDGALCDLMWSDPEEEIEGWELSPRGGGWLFGSLPVQRFIQTNNLELIARAHQLVNEGYKYQFNEQLVTVWSAPNYCYRCANVASILQLDSDLKRSFKIFDAVPDDQRVIPPRQSVKYFL